jgi:hypothetical protein
MAEAVVYEEEQLRRAKLGLDVDGDAVASVFGADMHLVVWCVSSVFASCVYNAALQDPIVFERHSSSSLNFVLVSTRFTQ